uniref:Uncharacterized protein n=1 Tax=Trichogramma kaykai TaxID=54128 RepID=A0ABD2VW09_9HYME
MEEIQKKIEEIKSLRDKVCNWEIEKGRYDLLYNLYPLILWLEEEPPCNFKDIFHNGEIERLLSDSIRHWSKTFQYKAFIIFVANTRYRDKPKIDEAGKPVRRRTTALHVAAKEGNMYMNPILAP